MLDEVRTPRFVVAGTASSVGKTTLTAGLIAALKGRGKTVQSFKVGPDYIDPAYLAHVTGRPCRNLDSWMLGHGALQQVFAKGSLGADVADVIRAPIILVIDVARMSESAAAVAMGFKMFKPDTRLAGVLLNNVASDGHRRSVEEAVWESARVPVLGALPAMPDLGIPERQLGLLPVSENTEWERILGLLADAVQRNVDLDLIWKIAEKAELLPLVPKKVFQGKTGGTRPVRLAVAYDDAFNFYYPENLELLEEYGAEIVPFSPLEDSHLPADAAGAYLGGGFPAEFVERLAKNRPMAESLHRAYRTGMPIYAECGGLMYLGRTLRTAGGT